MHIVGVLLTGIISGLTYWFVWGNGMEHVDFMLGRQRNAKRRALAVDQAKRAPLKAIQEPRDAATILMVLVASRRGEMTGEQEALILGEMASTLEYVDDVAASLAIARHAAANAPTPEVAVGELRDLLRKNLGRSEFNQLFLMLRKVASLHGGPTDEQEKLIAYAERTLPHPR